ncbi:GmrSD restriction endonuclease domain-containing protein [Mucilaginibacter flavidus]|uniref:GmrSD restriction endonuclease domain-containing protein n=1 Tax=Mucilaginibacter flavidus TaxID=2949309 RepID=UPI00209253A2|nr:DUF262 domain-containing protein [Mucilaginibacter flavidus]MCO5946623.1 DUF262 domain-containing protein [Mucilaginibacter flavidus]
MDVTKKLIIRPETVETIFDYYSKDMLLVNRRYQRKLVWTIEEKESFIDSISLNYPVPLFLVAEIQYKGDTVLEIIDGMQRLNAIITFIEGEFSYNGQFFDLEAISGTKLLLDKKLLKQSVPKLNRDICKAIASYQLPLSVSIFKQESAIDDIFKRINSSGKHLSSQEIRQAGSTNSFGKLVRILSESIRGDVSHTDRLSLNKMKKISINSRKLDYGINLGGIFWRKHNIITAENIRESRDEEIVANLLSAILIEPRPAGISKNLDEFYKPNNPIEQKIKKLGDTYLVTMFEAVFEELRNTFESTSSSFFKILFQKETHYVNRSFPVFFLAFYDLLVKEQLKIINHQKLATELVGFGDKYLTPNADDYNLSKQREQGIEVVKGFIRKHFSKRTQNDPALNNGVIKLENLLGGSNTENTSYDFKIGFHRLQGKNEFDENAFEKVLKTLTAIANGGKESIGYVVIGVADNKNDSDWHEKFYKTKSIPYKKFFVTGVQNEVKNYKSDEDYRSKIENKIRMSKITPSKYIDQLLRNIDYFNYYDKTILILKIQMDKEPVKFGEHYYERQGTSTVEVKRDKEVLLWQRILSS